MMPSVEFRATDNVVKKSQSYIYVTVLEKSGNGIENKICSQDIFANSTNHKWQRVQKKLKGLFQGVKSTDV